MRANGLGFLSGGGELGALMRMRDWSASPLGPPETWPQSLRTVAGLMLDSKYPMFIAWGRDLTFLYNDAYQPILGAKHPRALGLTFRQVWSEIWDDIRPLIERALAGEATWSENLPLVMLRNGYPEQTYYTFSYSPARDESGAVAGMFCACTETTAQVLADQRTAFRLGLEDRLRDLADPRAAALAAAEAVGRHLKAARAGYGEIGEDGATVFVERDWTDGAAMSLAGMTRILDAHGPLLIAELRAGRTLKIEDRLNDRRIGEAYSEAWARIGTRALIAKPLVKGGRLTAVFYVHERRPRDWTDGEVGLVEEAAERAWSAVERARAEERLRLFNDTLEAKVEARTRERDRIWRLSSDLFVVADLSNRVVVINPAAEAALGWTADELGGEGFLRIVHPDDQDASRAIMAGFAQGRPTPLYEGRYRRKDGVYRRISWAMTFEDGLIYGTGRDVTDEKAKVEEIAAANRQLKAQIAEREKVEATLRQMQRLEAVGQLTAGVAHDFNNLLTIILGNLMFLERKLDKDEALARRLGAMQTAAERGAKLTTQLLAFARRSRLEPKPINLNEIVLGMSDLLSATMGGAVSVENALKDDLWPALVDPTQIELVILNLAINARDAMERGGALRIETANVALREPPRRQGEPEPGDYVRLSVRDEGTGMADEVVEKAFEPFFTTKPVGKGSGLGLSQALGFAQQSGGGVRIETRLGEGTAVHVFLPRAARAGARAEKENEPRFDKRAAQEGGDARPVVLLVDDDGAVRDVTAAMLDDLGYAVVEAGSGGAGLDALDRHPRVDLLLVDFAMPGMTGAEMAHEARARRPGLPIVFVTGYADLAAFKEFGEERVVAKPFGRADLAKKVKKALDEAAGATRR